MMEEIHPRQIPTKSGRINLPGQGVIGSGPNNWEVSPAFTPDGTLLASSAGDTTASVWEVATGKGVGGLRFGDSAAYINSVSFSDDGRWLAAGRQGEYVVRELPAPFSQRVPGPSEKD